MAKKKIEETKIEETKPITNEELLAALEIMDKKLNIVCNVMLELQKYLDDKAHGRLGIGK